MCLDDLFYYESSDNVLKNEKKEKFKRFISNKCIK